MTHNYRPDAPFTTTLAPPDLPGRRLVITGTVYGADCVTPVSGALIEVWHNDPNGLYDQTPPYRLRAKLRTDENGRYRFTTVKPGYTQTRYVALPPFIHYRVSYQGEILLSTHMFFAGDHFLNGYWSTFPDLVVSLTEQPGSDGPILHGRFDLAVPLPVE